MKQLLRSAVWGAVCFAACIPGTGNNPYASTAHAQTQANPLAELKPAFVEKLRALAQSQGNRYSAGPVVLPPRPRFAAIETYELPASFCSEKDRNAFHDGRFKPAIERASKNNLDAIAHMNLLLRLHNEFTTKGDGTTATAIAKEAKAFDQVARSINLERTSYDSAFSRLMAVPVMTCGGAKQ